MPCASLIRSDVLHLLEHLSTAAGREIRCRSMAGNAVLYGAAVLVFAAVSWLLWLLVRSDSLIASILEGLICFILCPVAFAQPNSADGKRFWPVVLAALLIVTEILFMEMWVRGMLR